jgi:hypothetical protein
MKIVFAVILRSVISNEIFQFYPQFTAEIFVADSAAQVFFKQMFIEDCVWR